MLHEIWAVTTVDRVAQAVSAGLECDDQVIVVGIKAEEVANGLGPRPGRLFAYQENLVTGRPAGTGDAVRVALDAYPSRDDRDVYIFLGDMGLLTGAGVAEFRDAFQATPCDMMILTGNYSGPVEQNYYGRIVRVPALAINGEPSADDAGKVIEIIEHKDILGLSVDEGRVVEYNGRGYAFDRDGLLNSREINTGVFAFKEPRLRAAIGRLDTDNAQGEYLLTDIVDILNREGRVVRALLAGSEEEILAFNTKGVLRQMERIARRRAYERLQDIVTLTDPEDFFIADPVIDRMEQLDKQSGPLEITFGKGVHVDAHVHLSPGVCIGDRSRLSGKMNLGSGVTVGADVTLAADDAQILLGENAAIGDGVTITGDVRVARQSQLGRHITISGSTQAPCVLGEGVHITGNSHLNSCRVDHYVRIEHCILHHKHVAAVENPDGTIQPIRYQIPPPEGTTSVKDL